MRPPLFRYFSEEAYARAFIDKGEIYARPLAYSRAVDYRNLAAALGVDWALPERVAFIKPVGWAWQSEHRIVLGLKGAFDVENVECALESGEREPSAPAAWADPLILHVGDLSKITELHRF